MTSILESLVLDGLALNGQTSSFVPTSVTGCELWLAADNITGKADGDAVATWTDASGSAHDATQAVGANQPIYKTNIVNGKPVLRFDGTNDRMDATLLADTSRTIFIVAKEAANTNLREVLEIGNGNATVRNAAGVWNWASNQAAGTQNIGGTTTSWSLITLKVTSAASMDTYLNGAVSSGNFDPSDIVTTATAWSIGSGLVPSVFWDGDIAEIISYSSALGSTDLDNVRNYLGMKYGLGFGSGAVYDFRLQGYDVTPPPKRQEWAQGADIDGAQLVRDPLFENREITLRLRVAQQTTMDLALAQIATLSKKLEEAEQQPDGLALVWTPAGGSNSVTFYVLSGTVEGMPLELSGDDAGWFLRAPVITVKLICKPFGYGTPVTSSTASSATPFVTMTIASQGGDVPAEGRLQITDAATQDRRYVEWGLQQRYYDAATSLLVDSDDMVTTGYSGFQTTRGGAYDPNASGNSIIRGTLTANPLAMCASGTLSHVGTYRVKARVYASVATEYIRFSWQEGDGPYRSNPYITPSIGGTFSEVDLGLINIPPKQLGTQRWQGRVEGYTTGTPGTDTLDVDYLVLVPAGEGYGKARAQIVADSPTAPTARDEFIQTAGALNAKTAPVGGAWATSGDATDLSVTGSGAVTRAAVSDAGNGRFAISGVAASALQAAQIDFSSTIAPLSVQMPNMGTINRWVDISNYCTSIIKFDSGTATFVVQFFCQVAAATVYSVTSARQSISANAYYTMRTLVDATGRVWVWFYPQGTPPSAPVIFGQHSSLATGGTLASGKPGFKDFQVGSTACTRTYDNFVAWVPTIPTAIYSGRVAEIRHDGAIRQDSTGVYYGPVPAYRGSRFLVPPAGDDSRTSRILVKAHRTDIEAEESNTVTDNLTIQTVVTPRYLVVPF